MDHSRFFSFIHNKNVQLTAMLITALYSLMLLVIVDSGYHADESYTKISPVTTKMTQYAQPITIGMHIEDFPSSRFEQNEFVMNAIVWFKFPIGTESLETIQNFTFDNSIIQSNGLLLYKSEPNIKIIDDETIVAYDIQVMFKAALDHSNFPIGDHKLNIVIYNKSVSAHETIFISEPQNFTFSEDLMISNWRQVGKKVTTGYSESITIPEKSKLKLDYPAAVFTIDFESVGFRDLTTLYFPMLVIFFIGLASLVITITDITRLTFIATSVPMLVLFRMVIDSMAPGNIGYTTHVDFVFYLLVLLSLALLFFQTYITLCLRDMHEMNDQEKNTLIAKLNKENDITLIASLIIVMAAMTYSGYLIMLIP